MKPRPIIMPAESPEERAKRIQRIAAFLLRLPADKAWELLPRPFKRTRTERQNNAMWGVAYKTLSDYTGYSEPEIHELMCRGHFGEVEDEALGMKRIRPRRTTTTNERGERDVLSRAAMSEFYAFVVQKAAEIGCYIEDPDPQLRTRAA